MNTNRVFAAAAVLALLMLPIRAGAGQDTRPVDDDTRQVLEEAARKAEVVRQRHVLLAEHHFKVGERLFEELRFAEARDEFTRALKHNPQHPQAASRLRTCNNLLGDGVDTPDELLLKLVEHRTLDLHRAQAHLNVRIADAREQIANENYNEAIDNLLVAQAMIQWLEPQLDVSAASAQTKELLSQARQAADEKAAREDAEKRQRAHELARAREIEHLQTKQRRIEALLDRARAMMAAGRYASAEQALRAVLVGDPDSPSATSLAEHNRQLRNNERRRRTTRSAARAERIAGEQIAEASVPAAGVLTYPEEWGTTKGLGRSRIEQRPIEPWRAELEQKLQRPIAFSFTETPLQDVCRFISAMTDIDVVLDPDATGSSDAALTLDVKDMPLATALKWITQLTDTAYQVHDGAIYIAPPDKLREEPTTRLLEVSDLIMPIRQFPASRKVFQRIGLGKREAPNAWVFEDERQEDEEDRAVEQFMKFIRSVLGPGEWIRLPDGSLAWTETTEH